MVDGAGCVACEVAKETETVISTKVEQPMLSTINKTVNKQSVTDCRDVVDSCKQLKTNKMCEVMNQNCDVMCTGDRNSVEQTDKRIHRNNCDILSENETNDGECATNVGASDSGVGGDLGIDDDDDADDPYAELEFYLEKVKVSLFLKNLFKSI